LSDMAKAPFLRDVTNYLADQPDIGAILVGAGCNDLVAGLPGQQLLYKMLKPLSEGGDSLDEAAVTGFIDGALFRCYDTVIKTLTTNFEIPVLIHGYDHPIPDGRRDMVLIDPSGPWLRPFFEARGYDIKSQHLSLASEVMKRLIDRLNAAIKKAAAAYPNRAYYVDLAGTLAQKYGDADKYDQLWANELHPNEEGFDLLAAQVAKQLKDLKIG
jgi:hypothetical protein